MFLLYIQSSYLVAIHTLQGYLTATLGNQHLATFLQRSFHACSVTPDYFDKVEDMIDPLSYSLSEVTP